MHPTWCVELDHRTTGNSWCCIFNEQSSSQNLDLFETSFTKTRTVQEHYLMWTSSYSTLLFYMISQPTRMPTTENFRNERTVSQGMTSLPIQKIGKPTADDCTDHIVERYDIGERCKIGDRLISYGFQMTSHHRYPPSTSADLLPNDGRTAHLWLYLGRTVEDLRRKFHISPWKTICLHPRLDLSKLTIPDNV